MDRRSFLKTLGIAGATAFSAKSYAGGTRSKTEMNAILVDTTRCMGCRSCEYACAEYHSFPEPAGDDSKVYSKIRNTKSNQFTLVNRFEADGNEVFVKKNCMHCSQPACAAACLTKAMYKTPEGPVIWREDKCMGCRYCMISCPFDIPKFEYQSANPKIRKCNMCHERTAKGELPVCVENCPGEAIMYGKRSKIIEEARMRVYQNPDEYTHHIYGETEAGGTCLIYLANTEFKTLGFKQNIENKPYPELTTEFLFSVPVIETLLPPFLVAMSYAAGKKSSKEKGVENEDEA